MVIENRGLKKSVDKAHTHTDERVREENGEVNWGHRMVDLLGGGVNYDE